VDKSADDKKDLFKLLNEIKHSNKLDLDSAKEKAIQVLENKPK
jgi:hypothetical protein